MSLILKDKMNWHTFEASFRPESFMRRKEGESASEWLERVSIKDSGWLEKYEFRKKNKYWCDSSSKIALQILSFLRRNNMEKSELEDWIGFELNLRGDYDWSLSELKKIELFINEKIKI